MPGASEGHAEHGVAELAAAPVIVVAAVAVG
ncbi:MAG: hypothetical protein JWL94_140 [Microbacteriaceae bacterium]|jgi:hypothetical protein|nr:hypothetical protein [Microbacteriaceae bacterium]